MNFHIFGMAVKLEFSFVLIIAFCLLTNNKSVLLAVLFSLLHEIGHLLCLLLFGGKPKSLVFACYGIGLKYDFELSFFKELLFLLSGVAVNLIFFLLGIERRINAALFFINILPVIPLDGGRVLRLVTDRVLEFDVSDRIFTAIEILFVAALFAAAVFAKNVSLFLIAVYAAVCAFGNYCS